MYIAPGQGQTTSMGTKFVVNRNLFPLWSFASCFKKSLFEVWFYTHFCHDFIHVYSPGAGGENPLGTKFWCQQKHLVTSVICYKFQNNLFEICFYTPFLILYMYKALGQGQTTLWWQSLMWIEKPYHFAHLLQVLEKSLWTLILYILFHAFIHVYSPRAGADNPLGTKFWYQKKYLVTFFICCFFH